MFLIGVILMVPIYAAESVSFFSCVGLFLIGVITVIILKTGTFECKTQRKI